MKQWLKKEASDLVKAVISVMAVAFFTALLQYLGTHIHQLYEVVAQFIAAITTIKLTKN